MKEGNVLNEWVDANANGMVDADEFNAIRIEYREDADVAATGGLTI
jgi:hypothetical protein